MSSIPIPEAYYPELPPKPSKDITEMLFPGFARTEVRTSGATIPVVHKGDGPPVLLLHRYPETHATWHKVAPRLAEQFSVYVPDLRGYGDSSRPPDGDRHINYAFCAMALDQVETMRHRSDFDDVSTNESGVCDPVHVVVLPCPSDAAAGTSHRA